MLKSLLSLLALFVSFIGFSQTATIGNQLWSTANLDVNHFRNGDIIPEAKSDKEWIKASKQKKPAWCYYNNDPANGKKYGKLYNWYAVNDPRGLAPEGWHIPTSLEWSMLINQLGGDDVAGKKMKSKQGWIKNGNGDDVSEFSGLPGGYRYDTGSFILIDYNGYWWSTTDQNSYFACCNFSLDYSKESVSSWVSIPKGEGLSVRCVKD